MSSIETSSTNPVEIEDEPMVAKPLRSIVLITSESARTPSLAVGKILPFLMTDERTLFSPLPASQLPSPMIPSRSVRSEVGPSSSRGEGGFVIIARRMQRDDSTLLNH